MLHTSREWRLTCVAMLAPLSLDHAITAAATSSALSVQFSLSIRSPGRPCSSKYLARTLPTNANDPYALRDVAMVVVPPDEECLRSGIIDETEYLQGRVWLA